RLVPEAIELLEDPIASETVALRGRPEGLRLGLPVLGERGLGLRGSGPDPPRRLGGGRRGSLLPRVDHVPLPSLPFPSRSRRAAAGEGRPPVEPSRASPRPSRALARKECQVTVFIRNRYFWVARLVDPLVSGPSGRLDLAVDLSAVDVGG